MPTRCCLKVPIRAIPDKPEGQQSQALEVDWIFQPVRRLCEWLRCRAARHLERRQEPRRMVVNLAAHYWDVTAAARHSVRDVSAGGAFIFAEFKWPLGTILTLTLQPNNQVGSQAPQAPLLRAKVVRCASEGLGVQFVCFSKAERQDLADFLESIPECKPS
jgi:hypothetical protein